MLLRCFNRFGGVSFFPISQSMPPSVVLIRKILNIALDTEPFTAVVLNQPKFKGYDVCAGGLSNWLPPLQASFRCRCSTLLWPWVLLVLHVLLNCQTHSWHPQSMVMFLIILHSNLGLVCVSISESLLAFKQRSYFWWPDVLG